MNKPIPAFYACYLLRSTVRHASLYVGSTPNPVRRLKQHNGKGGAVRTSRESLRPWEMTCLVTGFPSKIAALQFEWAWQHTELTRHVSPNSRLNQPKTTVRISPKTGRPRKRTTQSRQSLTDRLANLHLLLRASSFERWPLNVTFYAEDVFRVWQKWTKQGVEPLRPGIEINLDQSSQSSSVLPELNGDAPTGIQAIDVGYNSLKPHLEKSKALLATSPRCTICSDHVPNDGAMTLTCPKKNCNVASHLSCLAPSFSGDGEQLVPTNGNCPGCGTKLRWQDLVKELSLRMRGEEEIEKIFKVRKPRAKKGEAAAAAPSVAEDPSEDEGMVEDDLPELSESEEVDVDEPMPASNQHAVSQGRGYEVLTPRRARFVEDSDWDEAELVT